MNWKRKTIDVGVVKPKQKIKVTFESLDSLSTVKTVTSSCGCTSPKVSGNNIEVVYTPGNVPYHLKSRGDYSTRKTITVYYEDGNREVLSIIATIKE